MSPGDQDKKPKPPNIFDRGNVPDPGYRSLRKFLWIGLSPVYFMIVSILLQLNRDLNNESEFSLREYDSKKFMIGLGVALAGIFITAFAIEHHRRPRDNWDLGPVERWTLILSPIVGSCTIAAGVIFIYEAVFGPAWRTGWW